MADPVIRLDKSKPFSTVHGERMPDDPHYKVHYWQGGRLNGKTVQLPFDSQGELVADDNRNAAYAGTGQDSKGNVVPVTYQPLYTPLMRAFLKAKTDRIAQIAQPAKDAPVLEEDGDKADATADDLGGQADDEVNFVSWLKGEAEYPTDLLRKAARKRFGKNYLAIKPDLIVDLVLDEKIVPEDQVCVALKRYLPQSVAA
jgi:hypothetical protein